MSKFQRKIDSKIRVIELEKVFIKAIEEFNNKNPDLSLNEVGAVMLKMLTQANNGEIDDSME